MRLIGVDYELRVSDYAKRTEDIFKISRRSLNRIMSKGKSDANNNEKKL